MTKQEAFELIQYRFPGLPEGVFLTMLNGAADEFCQLAEVFLSELTTADTTSVEYTLPAGFLTVDRVWYTDLNALQWLAEKRHPTTGYSGKVSESGVYWTVEDKINGVQTIRIGYWNGSDLVALTGTNFIVRFASLPRTYLLVSSAITTEIPDVPKQFHQYLVARVFEHLYTDRGDQESLQIAARHYARWREGVKLAKQTARIRGDRTEYRVLVEHY